VSCFIHDYAERHYADCRYAEGHSTECHYAECRGAVLMDDTILSIAIGKGDH
jgi:hypothetical protein